MQVTNTPTLPQSVLDSISKATQNPSYNPSAAAAATAAAADGL